MPETYEYWHVLCFRLKETLTKTVPFCQSVSGFLKASLKPFLASRVSLSTFTRETGSQTTWQSEKGICPIGLLPTRNPRKPGNQSLTKQETCQIDTALNRFWGAFDCQGMLGYRLLPKSAHRQSDKARKAFQSKPHTEARGTTWQTKPASTMPACK